MSIGHNGLQMDRYDEYLITSTRYGRACMHSRKSFLRPRRINPKVIGRMACTWHLGDLVVTTKQHYLLNFLFATMHCKSLRTFKDEEMQAKRKCSNRMGLSIHHIVVVLTAFKLQKLNQTFREGHFLDGRLRLIII